MPPHNSPNDTRPSTPPPASALSSHPYLQQLEAAISTPVPDLASTLTTPESNWRPTMRPRANTIGRLQERAERLWEQYHHPLHRQLGNSAHDLAASDTTVIEVDVDVDTNNTNAATTLPDLRALPSLDLTFTPLREILASQTGRERREARRHLQEGTREQEQTAAPGGDVDTHPRRELERALRNYRMARTTFRLGRHGSANGTSDVGPVPTATPSQSHIFQSRTQAAAAADASPFALSDFVEQHRSERQRRHLESMRRRSEQRARFEGQYESQRFGRRSSISNMAAARCLAGDDGPGTDSAPFLRVRNTIRYLSLLRGQNVPAALVLAHDLGLDALYDSCSDTVIASDLPLSADALPRPAKSSWLQPGMRWHGLQSTDREPTRSASTLLGSALRRVRPRDYLGRAMARRGYSNEPWTRDGYRSLAPIPVEAADRYLLQMMGDESSLAELGGIDAHPLITSERSAAIGAADLGDHWPVTVVLHEVDWVNMTVRGTMRACQIPDKTTTAECQDEGKSMESFFEGEIIDFDNNTLLADGQRFGYKVGGVDVDARYWARLGPFKREIDREMALLEGKVAKKWDDKSKYHSWLEKDDPVLSSEQRQRRESAAEMAMARALGSERWLRDKLAGEWVLMRWKDRAQAQWGLTISGFYYVALHRQSGRIDALYYDPGSQPYQSLRMAPEGCQLRDEIQDTSTGTGTGTDSAKELEGTGLKKWFPAMDFR
ncbi:hypothetical protein DV735_g5623, partial [Chaetothyriales sp. CBS 134920]